MNSINPIMFQQANPAQQSNPLNAIKQNPNQGQQFQGSNVQTSPQDILELGTQKHVPVTYQNPRITRTRAS